MKIILCKNAFNVRERELIPVPLKKSVRFYTIAKKQGLLDGNPLTPRSRAMAASSRALNHSLEINHLPLTPTAA